MKNETITLAIPEVKIYKGWIYEDERGEFKHFNSYYPGIINAFDHVNTSYSNPHVLRGLHMQFPLVQTKLVTCLQGSIYDVVVDARPNSPTCGQHVGVHLTGHSNDALWIPAWFLHGFYVTSEEPAIVSYYVDDVYRPLQQLSARWNDPDLAIEWPLKSSIIISKRDKEGLSFKELQQKLRSES